MTCPTTQEDCPNPKACMAGYPCEVIQKGNVQTTEQWVVGELQHMVDLSEQE